jgi:hypothetical protein
MAAIPAVTTASAVSSVATWSRLRKQPYGQIALNLPKIDLR